MALNIIKNYLTKNRCYKKNVKRTPKGIQIHTIGTGQGTAASVAEYWNQNAISACVTYCVDCDTAGKVLQFLPEDVRSWADAGYGNDNLITIEICESDYIEYKPGSAAYKIVNDAKFKADILRGYNTAVLLCADICNRYGWDPTAKLPNGLYLISSHDEGRRAGVSSAHVDPTHIWPKIGKTMDTFRADVKAAMRKTTSQTVNIKGVVIGDSNVEAISKVVHGEAGIIKSRDALLAVAQCIHDMQEIGGYGNTISQILENNFTDNNKETTDDARQAVYDVFVNGVRRFKNAKILQFRSFTNYSDGKGNMDPVKCAALLEKYEYLGKDARNNQWGHLYFGHKVESVKIYTVQAGSFRDKSNAEKLFRKIKKAGFDVVVKKVDGEYKVQCGVFEFEKNAKSLVVALKEKGFEAIIK